MTPYEQAMSALDEMLSEGGTAARLAQEVLMIEEDYQQGRIELEDKVALLEEVILIKAANDKMVNEVFVRRLVDVGRVLSALS